MLRDLACPACGAPGLEPHQPDGVFSCRHCGRLFTDDASVACPACEAVNPPDCAYCKSCGQKLKRACPACGASNWAGAEFCAACGRGIDAVSVLAERHALGFKGTLQAQRDSANRLKAEEEADSQRRMANLKQAEQRRQDYLSAQQAEQNRQQTMLVTVSLVSAFVCAATLIAIAALALMSR